MAVNEKVEKLLETIKLPFAYREFKPYKNKPVPEPPYIVYLIENENGFGADGKNLAIKKTVTVELYSQNKKPQLEKEIEQAISEFEYSKIESYIDSEKLFCIFYEFDIYEKTRRT